jgi:hypothetical protein
MIYEIEFFRWDDAAPNGAEIIRRHSDEFPTLEAARIFGFANTGTPDSPREAHWFLIYENGVMVSRAEIRHRFPNA